MGSQSTIYTIGTLLSRAEDHGVRVRVLVDGLWMEGIPVAGDGHGVILQTDEGQLLLRVEAICGVAYAPAAVEHKVQVPAQRWSSEVAPLVQARSNPG